MALHESDAAIQLQASDSEKWQPGARLLFALGASGALWAIIIWITIYLSF